VNYCLNAQKLKLAPEKKKKKKKKKKVLNQVTLKQEITGGDIANAHLAHPLCKVVSSWSGRDSVT